jgi:hypothetical protein
VTHEGRTREQINHQETIPEESRRPELMRAAQSLDRLGKSIDGLRKEHETDEQFVERLTPHFSSQPVDRR